MIMNICVQAALAFGGQVNPIPMDGVWKGQEWKLYCVYTCWIAFELIIVYLFYVETKYVCFAPAPPFLPISFTFFAVCWKLLERVCLV